MRSGRHEEAVQVYRQSLRYRPNYAATYLNLGYALKDGGRIDEAASISLLLFKMRQWSKMHRLVRRPGAT
jgi:tetratricopeptide (TPR) repeat protein